MGLKSTGGEIVEVQGGHIIRATGRKDRHSKVFTAKGPRDRRVRLAAHTAIQFYDVQDRLGYDRPSKAVDWLINKAKDSIDKLAELPPWDPLHLNNPAIHGNVGASEQMSPFYVDSGGGDGGDGMKSFFPSNSDDISGENSNFPNYPQGFGRGSHQNHQDLCLSLHTLQDPGVTAASGAAHHSGPDDEHALFNGFDGGGGWAHQQDAGRFTRLMGWAGDSSGGGGGSGEGRAGIMFSNNNNSSPLFLSTMANYGNDQRGALQSNYSSMTRDFEYNHNHYNHGNNSQNHHQVVSGLGHGSDTFMGFYIPSQIHGDLHGGGGGGGGGEASMSNRASSSSLSSDSTPH